MKTLFITLIFSGILVGNVLGQSPGVYRFEVDAGISTLSLPRPYYTGWYIRQQLTGYVRPRLGVALGLGRGSSANTAPLQTLNPASASGNQPDPAQLRDFYTRQDNSLELSVVALPVLSSRHQLKIQAGLSVYRQRELGVDSIFRDFPGSPVYRIAPRFTDARRLVPMASVGYDFRLSNRWSIGLNGSAYITPNGTTTTVGLRTAYRFNLPGDSLGFGPVSWKDVRAGIRLGAGFVGENGASSGSAYWLHGVGGLWAELPLSLTWSLRGEVNYTKRGYQRREIDLGSTRYPAASARLGYLEVPLLFRHEIAYRWQVYLGPYLAFFLNGYTESNGVRNPPVSANTQAGLLLGTSYNLTKQLFADLRYQRDLVQLSSTPYTGFHGYQLSLGWAFR